MAKTKASDKDKSAAISKQLREQKARQQFLRPAKREALATDLRIAWDELDRALAEVDKLKAQLTKGRR
jgi:hypothetical protein